MLKLTQSESELSPWPLFNQPAPREPDTINGPVTTVGKVTGQKRAALAAPVFQQCHQKNKKTENKQKRNIPQNKKLVLKKTLNSSSL